MSPFATKIRQCITQYKRILKRHLSATAYTLKVKTLHIKRKELKNTSDVELFHIANRVLRDIETWLAKQDISAIEFSGLDEFRQHIKNTLCNYSLEGDKVVNTNQQASRLIVESIQLLGLPFSDRINTKLIKNITLLKELGNEEALNKLGSALLKKNAEMNNQFLPILELIH